jgi:hypothetical protein
MGRNKRLEAPSTCTKWKQTLGASETSSSTTTTTIIISLL